MMSRNIYAASRDLADINKTNGAFAFHPPPQNQVSDDDNYSYGSDDDEYTDEEDDEYEPVAIAAWGDKAKEEPASWNNLIDSSVKIKAGGVGSGDLHRRGGNFKPLSEAIILAQRLSKPIPGKKGKPGVPNTPGTKKKKKRGGKAVAARKATRPVGGAPPRRPIFPPPTVYKLPERQPPANAPPSTWGSKPLSETPFWEVQKPVTPVTVAPVPERPAPPSNTRAMSQPITPIPDQQYRPVASQSSQSSSQPAQAPQQGGWGSVSLVETPFWEVKKEEAPVVVPAPLPPTVNSATSQVKGQPPVPQKVEINLSEEKQNSVSIAPEFKPLKESATWNPEAAGFTPKAKAYNANAPSFTPSPITSPSKSNTMQLKATYNANAPSFTPLVQPPKSVPVKITPPSLLGKQLQTIQKTLPSTKSDLDKPKETSSIGKPCLTITLAIADGISALIHLYPDSDPVQVANDFGKNHNLIVAEKTRADLARTFSHLLETKRSRDQAREHALH